MAPRRWFQTAINRLSENHPGAAVTDAGTSTVDRATEAFRAVDIDGDGIADKPRAATAAEEAGAALKGAAAGVAGAFGTLFARKQADSATGGATAGES
ncbi:hypothetical protein [Microbacterium testaceum]|uniref:hypothetical protein n=1 Tax=Microbacterium testaceum TaxID=2033 RepID=UPI002AC3E9D0|nr:hypothetical protein [Microbacterium testaceum]MDZ5145671.1 hypothetical protein [Microbacterium testaceum]